MKEIKLTQGKIAIVDDDDYETVIQHQWHYAKGYAFTYINKKRISLHIFLRGIKNIDHKNNNGLDCRFENMREASHSQNAANRCKRQGTNSKYKGVAKIGNKWRTTITALGKRYIIGSFKTEVNAATAYNFAADDLFGEYANFNTPIEA